MQNNQSIKKTVAIFVLLACSLLVVSYSILVNIFFEKGLALSVQHGLELEAKSYAEAYDKDTLARLPDAANLRTYQNYDDLPDEVKNSLGLVDMPAGKFVIVKSNKADEEKLHFVYSWKRQDGVILYFAYSLGNKDRSEIIHSTAKGIVYYSIATGLISFLGILLVAFFMIRRIARLVMRLSDWAFHLDKDNFDDPIEDFQYKELNQLAVLYKKNMSRQLLGIQREQRFLRNASHELRTPVAVLQSNLDWLSRLGAGDDEKMKRPLLSMRKAVKNMKELISTLLWVGKKDIDSLQKHEISVDRELLSIIEESSYLIANKDVQIRKEISAQTVVAPEILGRIVWSNIIRNAFQHTHEGTVEIFLSDGVLKVKNALVSDAGGAPSDSFGLGLMLIQELTESIGWKLEFEESSTSYLVTLNMIL